MLVHMPLTDITNYQNIAAGEKQTKVLVARRSITRHDPYGFKCLEEEHSTTSFFDPTDTPRAVDTRVAAEECCVPAVQTPTMCTTLVQFKCHQGEYTSSIDIGKGQYVVVQGDRGIDIGVVIRINTDQQRTFVERGPFVGCVIRHATQSEVDYWATDLKEAEASAVAFCQARVQRHGYEMEVVHAEYQFDKKKLTFYYEARTRVDFVALLKELYKEFGCRIWMEKVRLHE